MRAALLGAAPARARAARAALRPGWCRCSSGPRQPECRPVPRAVLVARARARAFGAVENVLEDLQLQGLARRAPSLLAPPPPPPPAEALERGAAERALGGRAHWGLGRHRDFTGSCLALMTSWLADVLGLVGLQPLHGASLFRVGLRLAAKVVGPLVEDAQGHNRREGAGGADRLHHATCL